MGLRFDDPQRVFGFQEVPETLFPHKASPDSEIPRHLDPRNAKHRFPVLLLLRIT
jgi:hypothetical protein